MKTLPFFLSFFLPALIFTSLSLPPAAEPWVELINGKDMSGWKASENKATWSVTPEGYLQAVGNRSHLFYEGEHLKNGFKNFEMEVQVRTFKNANSGVYFHTEYQESGWPGKGIEIQVNNSYVAEGDYVEFKKMASLYGVRNVYKTFAKDDEWMLLKARVESDRVQIWINGIKTVDYLQPNRKMAGIRPLASGTFCLQGHDPGSKMQYRSFKVRRLPDDAHSNRTPLAYAPWQDSITRYQGQQFAFIDLNPHTILSAKAMASIVYNTGINAAWIKQPEQAKLMASAKNLPLFKGSKVNVLNINLLNSSQVDYVLGESLDLTTAETLLNSKKINIWSDRGKVLKGDQADALLDLAAQNKVAIEIDNEAAFPSIEIIKKAKAKGCKFSFAGLIPEDKLGQSLYFLEVIRSARLNYKDLYVPGQK